MAKRSFRSDDSVAAEETTRARIEPLLQRHGFVVTRTSETRHGTAVTQMIEAALGERAMRIHLPLLAP